MGNDPGKPVKDKEKSRVFIDITGPFDDKAALAFKNALDDLLKTHAKKCGGIEIAIKKP